MHPKKPTAFPLLLASSLLLGGCFGTSPPSQFYMLEPLRSNSPAGSLAKPLIALGPVRVPGYVDRPQIVRATGKNAYHLAETNRWAEPLGDNVARVLIQDLSQRVPAEVLPANGSNRARQASLKLSLNLLEFHVDESGQARLTAQWQLLRQDGSALSRQASYHAQASNSDYGVMVQGLNRCLDQLSQDLAAALKREAL